MLMYTRIAYRTSGASKHGNEAWCSGKTVHPCTAKNKNPTFLFVQLKTVEIIILLDSFMPQCDVNREASEPQVFKLEVRDVRSKVHPKIALKTMWG